MTEVAFLIVNILVGALLIAALLKLVFKLHRKAQVGWKNAWLCSVMLLLIGLVLAILANLVADSPLQYAIYAIGFATQVAVSSLFLGKRVNVPEEGPIGAKKAASSISLLIAAMLVLAFVFHAFLPAASQ